MNKRFFLFALLLYGCAVIAQTSISRAEYWIDSDPGLGKASMLAISGQSVNATISTASLTEGLHTLGLRAQGGGNWSTTATRLFYVPSAETAQIGQLTGLEYFVDTDPGLGNAVSIPYTAGQESFVLSLSQMDTLTPGLHTLGLRARNGYMWSTTSIHWFATVESGLATDELTAVEYWLDDDPGLGLATAIPFTEGQTEFALNLQQMDTLSPGIHILGLRARRGPVWSETYTKKFLNAVIHSPMEVTSVEAYWDADTTNIISLPYTNEGGYYQVTGAVLNTTNLTYGPHILYLRATADGIRSVVQTYEVCKNAIPQFSFQQDTICVGDEATILDESQDVQLSTTYAWDVDGNGTTDYTDKGDLLHTFTKAGKYNVTLTVQTGEGCETSFSRELVVLNKSVPSVSLSRTKSKICAGESVTFTATPTNGGYNPTYTWLRNGIAIPEASEATLTLDDLQNAETVQVQLNSSNPCATTQTALSSVLTQTVYDLPVIEFLLSDTYYTDENAFSLTDKATPTGGTFYIDDTEVQLFNPKANEVGIYIIRYVVTNSNGCTSEAEMSFELKERGEGTGFEDVQKENVQCTKVLRDNHIYILRGEKVYTVTGQEIIVP